MARRAAVATGANKSATVTVMQTRASGLQGNAHLPFYGELDSVQLSSRRPRVCSPPTSQCCIHPGSIDGLPIAQDEEPLWWSQHLDLPCPGQQLAGINAPISHPGSATHRVHGEQGPMWRF